MNHKELLEAQERAFGAGITVAAGFDLSAKSPLDTRICVKTIQERDSHVTNHRAYEGMIVYVEDTKLTYQYMGTSWKEFGFNQADFQKGIVNDLTTGGTGKALSAEQGKVLDGKKADKSYVDSAVNNVHTHSNKSILDATQQAFTTTLKNKLDGIATGANKYELPKATSSVLGGIKLGSGLVSDSNGVVSALMSGGEVYCMNKEEEFTATANQTLFVLQNGYYMGNCGAIEVYVNGSKVPMKDVREHDTYDRISLPTGLLAGDKVLVRYTQLSRLVGDDGHTHSNKSILDAITTDKIQHWDKGGSGAVLVSSTPPPSPTLNMLWVEFK